MNNTANYANCIIEVIKNSRTKFKPAKKGMILYTIHDYTNSWGTQKIVGIDETGTEYQATLKSIKFLDKEKSLVAYEFRTDEALVNWIEKSHIPIIFKPIARSRNNTSYKSKIAHSKMLLDQDTWISSRLVRDSTGAPYEDLKLNEYQTAFIPLWYANKIGLIRLPKNSY